MVNAELNAVKVQGQNHGQRQGKLWYSCLLYLASIPTSAALSKRTVYA